MVLTKGSAAFSVPNHVDHVICIVIANGVITSISKHGLFDKRGEWQSIDLTQLR